MVQKLRLFPAFTTETSTHQVSGETLERDLAKRYKTAKLFGFQKMFNLYFQDAPTRMLIGSVANDVMVLPGISCFGRTC